MKRTLRFRTLYLLSLVFWLGMTAWFAVILLRSRRGPRFEGQFSPSGEKFLFQEKKFALAYRGQVFGTASSFFSLSDDISFETDMSLFLSIGGTRRRQKIFGKIEADRLYSIRSVNIILKGQEEGKSDFSLASFHCEISDRRIRYELLRKDDPGGKITGDVPLKGAYTLFNPLYPFGRNLHDLKERKKYSAVYNPLRGRFERIEYTLTGGRQTINGQKTFEVLAQAYGIQYRIFVTPTGEMQKLELPSGFTLVQIPDTADPDITEPLNVEQTAQDVLRELKRIYRNNEAEPEGNP